MGKTPRVRPPFKVPGGGDMKGQKRCELKNVFILCNGNKLGSLFNTVANVHYYMPPRRLPDSNYSYIE